MEYDNKNRFSLWPNRKKREGKKDADFDGSINVTCSGCGQSHDYWINGWNKKSDAREGAPSLSGSIKPKNGKPQQQDSAPAGARRSMKDDMDDTIPF